MSNQNNDGIWLRECPLVFSRLRLPEHIDKKQRPHNASDSNAVIADTGRRPRRLRFGELSTLDYALVAWIQHGNNMAKMCEQCRTTPALFTYDACCQGQQPDMHAEEKIWRVPEEEIDEKELVEYLENVFQQILDEQRRGSYTFAQTDPLCANCLSARTNVNVYQEGVNSPTVKLLQTAQGQISCALVWHSRKASREKRELLLLYTTEPTVDTFLQILREEVDCDAFLAESIFEQK